MINAEEMWFVSMPIRSSSTKAMAKQLKLDVKQEHDEWVDITQNQI